MLTGKFGIPLFKRAELGKARIVEFRKNNFGIIAMLIGQIAIATLEKGHIINSKVN